MELSEKEKRQVFIALLHEYSQYERTRIQIKIFYSSNFEKQKQVFDLTTKEEKKAYKFLEKFAKEIGEKLPKYAEPIFETGKKN